MKKIFAVLNFDWWYAALMRCIKTMAQVALSMLTVGQLVAEIDWLGILSVSVVAGLASLLTSIVGLPELKTDGAMVIDTTNPEFDSYSMIFDKELESIPDQNIVRFEVKTTSKEDSSQE